MRGSPPELRRAAFVSTALATALCSSSSSLTPLYSSWFPHVALCAAKRSIVQSNSGRGLRSLLDQYEDQELAKKLRRNGHGNYYRYQQKLWPSQEAMERELTELTYSPVERTPLAMLPQRQRDRPRKVLACEGRGATALLEHVVSHDLSELNRAEETSLSAQSASLEVKRVQEQNEEEELDFMMELAQADQSITSRITTERDIKGSMLESAQQRAREIIGADLSVNTLALAPQDSHTECVAERLRTLPSARDLAGASWHSLGLDPVMSQVATAFYGAVPSRLQTRLLPALLNEDHNDILFNGVTGSGKTSSMLLALLQGVRSESVGMNVLVAGNTMNAMRLHDAIKAMCSRPGVGGGRVVDRPQEDYSWLMMGTFREDYEKYYTQLRRSLKQPHGPVRLFITTADVMCQLLFEKKLEFEGFGYLRRVYMDDVGAQIPMVADTAPVEEIKERHRNPLAAELLLGTLHQLPGPHIRSVMQLGLVSADLDGRLKEHLMALCVKPTAHTVVLSPVRIPTTVHCLFSHHLLNESVYSHVAKLAWNARATIPGRAVIFVKDADDVLHVRRTLRGLGMKAKIFSEVYADGAFQDKWKFLILKESEAFGVDIPLVSHVFITFAPTSWQSFQHMCGRAGRLGNVGWVYTICDKRDANHVRGLAEDLAVDYIHHVIDVNLKQIDACDADRVTRTPALYGMDPQYAVQQHYDVQAENPDVSYRVREFFSKPAVKQFQMEDYTPIPTLQRRFDNANMLARDVEKNPRIAMGMQQAGFLDEQLRPTGMLKRAVDKPTSKSSPAPFEKNNK